MRMRRDFPPSGNGDKAPRLVVFEVPVKGCAAHHGFSTIFQYASFRTTLPSRNS